MMQPSNGAIDKNGVSEMGRSIAANEMHLLRLAAMISRAQNDDPEIILQLKGRFRRGCDEKLADARGWFNDARDQEEKSRLRTKFARYGIRALKTRERIKKLGLESAAKDVAQLTAPAKGVGTVASSARDTELLAEGTLDLPMVVEPDGSVLVLAGTVEVADGMVACHRQS